MGGDPDGRAGGKELGRAEGVKTVIRVYYVGKDWKQQERKSLI